MTGHTRSAEVRTAPVVEGGGRPGITRQASATEGGAPGPAPMQTDMDEEGVVKVDEETVTEEEADDEAAVETDVDEGEEEDAEADGYVVNDADVEAPRAEPRAGRLAPRPGRPPPSTARQRVR